MKVGSSFWLGLGEGRRGRQQRSDKALVSGGDPVFGLTFRWFPRVPGVSLGGKAYLDGGTQRQNALLCPLPLFQFCF